MREKAIRSVITRITVIKNKIISKKIISDAFSAVLEFFICFMLSRGVIFGEISPFGVAYVGAMCAVGRGFFAILGAFLGYFSYLDGGLAIKYLSASLLAITAAYLCKDFKVFEKRIFMPLATAIAVLFISAAFLVNEGIYVSGILMVFSESVITLSLVYFYMLSSNKIKNSPAVLKFMGNMAVIGTVLISTYTITIFDIISPARVIALIIIMTFAYKGGTAKGATAGVAFGILMDSAAAINPFYAATYGVSALISGIFNKSGKTIFLCIYVIANATVSLLSISDPRYLSGLYESFFASMMFFLLPVNILDSFLENDIYEEQNNHDYLNRIRENVKKSLGEATAAFNELYLNMVKIPEIREQKKNQNYELNMLFDSAANQICKKCVLCNSCWEKDYMTTISAFSGAGKAINERGRAVPEDFPIHFSSRCIKFTTLLIVINEGIANFNAKLRVKERISEEKTLIAEQYRGISSVLRGFALNFSDNIEFVPLSEKKLRKYAEAFGNISNVSCYRDPFGKIRAEIVGDGITKILKSSDVFTAGLNTVLGVKFALPDQISNSEGKRLIFREKTNFKPSIGLGMYTKRGNSVSGDCATFFKNDYGKAFLVLCDGMGTGIEAHEESRSAIRIIERFLRAGISPNEALSAISPAIRIKNECLSFVTVDIAQIDLYTGVCEIYKCGAAPTYVMIDGKIRKISSRSMPVGVIEEKFSKPELTSVKLREGDSIIMVTDGISESQDENELVNMFYDNEMVHPKEFSSQIIRDCMQNNPSDDMTTLVMRLETE